MTQGVSQTETVEVFLAPFDLLEGTSESTRAKTAETFLELLGARVRNPNTRSAYRVAWRSFLAFCSARQLELENVKAYHVGSWLDQHPGSRSTQRQHLAAVRLLFDSLMMRGVVEYNPAARAKPPRLVRESSHTPVFEEAEIVAFLDSINLESLKDVRDKAIYRRNQRGVSSGRASQLQGDGRHRIHEFGRHHRDRAADRRPYQSGDHQDL
jgi:site-specific recombinase XerC